MHRLGPEQPIPAVAMTYQFIAFHTMTRGTEKPAYVVNCAKALADRGIRVLVLDGLMYEQGAIPHRLHDILGAAPVREPGRNLYDLIRDYETLCSNGGGPPRERDNTLIARLRAPGTRFYRGLLYPDIVERLSEIPGYPAIGYLPGNDGRVAEVRKRIDFQWLYDEHDGHRFFDYIRATLSESFELILINAPAGHQEISGILCGQVADLILAIDSDSPAVETDVSYEACKRLALRADESEHRRIDVKGVKGHSVPQVIDMIVGGA